MRLLTVVRILLVSLALAGYSAWVRERAPEGTRPSGRAVADIPLLRRADAEGLWQQGSTLFLDVRAAGDYAAGHIAGAVNCPEEEFEKLFPLLRPRLVKARTIVVYCSSVDCGKSLWAGLRLRREGLAQTTIYPGGWNEWARAGLPSTRPAW